MSRSTEEDPGAPRRSLGRWGFEGVGFDPPEAMLRAAARHDLRIVPVVHLSDLLLRRVRLGMWRPDVAAELAGDVASIAAAELGWSAHRIDEERERFARDLESWKAP